jgi:hypothetical protein
VNKKEKTIKLVNNIIKNMEYVRLLLVEGHRYISPMNTFYLTMVRLEELKKILEGNEL